ncbi:MAG: endoribonuclease YbeY [Vicingaceae bacterium]|nr:MAG: endoribonuclease YbeY [Vicingaceae bacterium]
MEDVQVYVPGNAVKPYFIKKKALTRWIKKVAQLHQCRLGPINIIFCTDEELREINLKYLNKSYYTDIITFDYSQKPMISGDLFISTDRVKDNAKHWNESYYREMHRVIIHGILHLIGFKDKSKKEQLLMRKAEDNALSHL